MDLLVGSKGWVIRTHRTLLRPPPWNHSVVQHSSSECLAAGAHRSGPAQPAVGRTGDDCISRRSARNAVRHVTGKDGQEGPWVPPLPVSARPAVCHFCEHRACSSHHLSRDRSRGRGVRRTDAVIRHAHDLARACRCRGNLRSHEGSAREARWVGRGDIRSQNLHPIPAL